MFHKKRWALQILLKWRYAYMVKIGNPRISGLAICGPTFGINFCCLLTPGSKAVFYKCPVYSFCDIIFNRENRLLPFEIEKQLVALLKKSNAIVYS
jgi:hypothetical protein